MALEPADLLRLLTEAGTILSGTVAVGILVMTLKQDAPSAVAPRIRARFMAGYILVAISSIAGNLQTIGDGFRWRQVPSALGYALIAWAFLRLIREP